MFRMFVMHIKVGIKRTIMQLSDVKIFQKPQNFQRPISSHCCFDDFFGGNLHVKIDHETVKLFVQCCAALLLHAQLTNNSHTLRKINTH